MESNCSKQKSEGVGISGHEPEIDKRGEMEKRRGKWHR